jgi:hypothetical protein
VPDTRSALEDVQDADAHHLSAEEIADKLWNEPDEDTPAGAPGSEPGPSDEETPPEPARPAARPSVGERQRGPDGRFLPPGQAAPAEPGEEPEGEEETPEGEESQAPAGISDIDLTDAQPLTVRAGGQDYAFEGVFYRADGSLYVQPEAATRYAELVQRGLYHETTWSQKMREMEGQVRAAQQQFSAKAAAGEEYAKFWLDLMAKGPEAMAEFFDGFEKNKAALQLKVEREVFEAERKAYTTGQEQEQYERGQESVRSTIQATVDDDLGQMIEGGFSEYFQPEDYPMLHDLILTKANELYFQAERDYTGAELAAIRSPQYPNGISIPTGVKAGQVILDWDGMHRVLSNQAFLIQRERQAAGREINAATAAQAETDRMNGGRGPRRTLPGSRGDVGGGAGQPVSRVPKTFEEWQQGIHDEIRRG